MGKVKRIPVKITNSSCLRILYFSQNLPIRCIIKTKLFNLSLSKFYFSFYAFAILSSASLNTTKCFADHVSRRGMVREFMANAHLHVYYELINPSARNPDNNPEGECF